MSEERNDGAASDQTPAASQSYQRPATSNAYLRFAGRRSQVARADVWPQVPGDK